MPTPTPTTTAPEAREPFRTLDEDRSDGPVLMTDDWLRTVADVNDATKALAVLSGLLRGAGGTAVAREGGGAGLALLLEGVYGRLQLASDEMNVATEVLGLGAA